MIQQKKSNSKLFTKSNYQSKQIPKKKTSNNLLSQLKLKYEQNLKLQQLLQNIQTLNNLSLVWNTLSQLLCQWVNLQISYQNLSKFERQLVQSYKPSNKLNRNEQDLEDNQLKNSKLIEYEYEVKCQITGLIPQHPARTNNCKFLCLVQRQVLNETGICACGIQVEKHQNQIVQDWVLQILIKFYKSLKLSQINLDQSKYINQQQLNQIKLIKNNKWKGKLKINLNQLILQFIFKQQQFQFQ